MNSLIRRNTLAPKGFTRNEFLTPFDNLFDDVFSNLFPTIADDLGQDFFVKGSYPKVNVINKSDEIVIEAAIPGLAKEDVDVEIIDNILTITGTSNQHKDISNDQYVRREIKKSAFQRSFQLGDNLDESNIEGIYDSGILTLRIPKLKPTPIQSEARKIEIT